MVAILFGAAVLVVGIAALVVGLGVARDAREARAALGDAGAALGRADAEAACAAFERARSASASALTRVRSLPASPLRIAPVVRTQTRVVEAIERAGGIMRNAAGFGDRALRELEDAPRGWLVGPVWSALEDAQDRLGGAVRGLRASPATPSSRCRLCSRKAAPSATWSRSPTSRSCAVAADSWGTSR